MAITAAGTGSGLDVNSIISQLMAIERQPLTTIQGKIKSYESQISDLGRVKSELSSLQTAVRELKSDTAFSVFSATSGDKTLFSATADSNAVAGSYTVVVNNLAKAQTLAINDTADDALTSTTAARAVAGGNLTFTINGVDKPVALAAGASLDDIRSAVNSADIGVSATIVNAGSSASPTYKLVFSTKETGTAGAITKIAADDAMALEYLEYNNGGANDLSQTQPAQDASVSINGVTVTGASNKITGAISGVTLELSKAGTSTLSVATDQEGINKKIQAFVDAYNKVRTTSDSLRQSGSLKGDSTLISLQNQLASELQTSVSSLAGSDYSYLSEVGIAIQKSGQLAFDSSKFKTAFEADTNNVKKLFSNSSTDGFMDRFDSRITELLQADGLIDSREDGVRERINQAKRKQDNIEYRLELVQRRLTAQFSALDASLGQMRQAGNYLASALG